MTPFSSSLPLTWEHLGVVAGFVLSLAIFSFVLRETFLARLAQYLLVGVTLGYVAVLTWQGVLWPRLVRPLLGGPLFLLEPDAVPADDALWLYWIPLGLGLILWLAGIDLLRRPTTGRGRNWRTWLHLLALLPAGIVAGVGIGVGVAGAIQGTLLPQFLRAAALGLPLDASPQLLFVGVLTLLITGGALIHLQLGERKIAEGMRPGWLRPLVLGWGWIGQRALWLAAGFIFARLFVSRTTLLIARLNYFLFELRQSDLWTWLRAVIEGGLR